MKPFIRPDYLKKGDTVAVIALGYALDEAGRNTLYWKELFESWGLHVKTGAHLYDKTAGGFAGSDEDRAADLACMLLDPDVKAIISFRGGYGSMRTVRAFCAKYGAELFLTHPKWLAGFSDITVFHSLLRTLELESIHGAMPCTFDENSRVSEESLRKALFGEVKGYGTAPHPYNRTGSARGRLVGGNLCLLHSCLGTPWDNPMHEDCILLLEEVDERMYNLDRMLLTLQQGGYFKRAKGIIVGQITDTTGEAEWQRNATDLIHEYMPDDRPVLFGFDAGHEHPNYSLYLGREATLDITDDGGYLKFL